jgi:hypothetical protein
MKYVVTKKGNVYFRVRYRGREIYKPLPKERGPSFDAAYEDMLLMVARLRKKKQLFSPDLPTRAARAFNAQSANDDFVPKWLTDLAREARKRAKRKRTAFALDLAALRILYLRAGETCEVSGVPFDHARTDTLYRPFAPSLDRICAKNGYTPGNVRLVSVMVNAAINQWGEDRFFYMVSYASQRLVGTREGNNTSGSPMRAAET